ncbi:hypothetical protein [Fluviicola sp.]|uniref:hypothetical protein n=1 Tax=Fluviicola sp. TaxID=1917219 RepID=UPI0026248A33|nr:hypothetical protein [Fluviicola sp.]
MAKKEYEKEDWQIFRGEILELVILYNQIKEYSDFDKDLAKHIKSFFFLSRNNAIAAFFIKVGFVLEDGTPTLRNFLSEEDILELLDSYRPKIKRIRDKFYAHNNKASVASVKLTNEEVDELYNKIISKCQKIDDKYDDSYVYSFVGNSEGIKSIKHIIEASNELFDLKESVIATNLEATLKMDRLTGKFHISE